MDDSPTETDFIRGVLAPTCQLATFNDGTTLLEALVQSLPPAALVLDWEVPGLSGIEVCEFLRSNRSTALLPVLLLTAHRDVEDVVRGLEAGADDYVMKPFRPVELVARVHALVRRDKRRQQALAEEQARRVLAENALQQVQEAETRAWQAENERTQSLEREQQARQAVETLEAETRQRADFERQLIGMVSHDLRSPLSAIALTAGGLKRLATDERQQHGLQRIRQSADRATRLIHDLLDFTRARQGQGIPVERKSADLHELVRTVVAEVRAAHPERAVELTHSGEGAGQWDPHRLEQVVSNLLSNALQYSPSGTGVHVDTQGEGDTVVLRVHNTGTPIPSELLPLLFEPMERGTAPVDSASRSIGLGLYIVRHLVLAHAGTVEVHSTPIEGTTFTVRLPRRLPETR